MKMGYVMGYVMGCIMDGRLDGGCESPCKMTYVLFSMFLDLRKRINIKDDIGHISKEKKMGR